MYLTLSYLTTTISILICSLNSWCQDLLIEELLPLVCIRLNSCPLDLNENNNWKTKKNH